MLKVESMYKSFGRKPVLVDVSFELPKGEAVALLGPNGAGKTTLINILAGASEPDSGNIFWKGVNRNDDWLSYRKHIGFLPDTPGLYEDLTAEEFLKVIGNLKQIGKDQQKKELRSLKEAFKLESVWTIPISRISRGFRQRVGLAQAFVGSPDLVFLDEPVKTLDPGQIKDLREWIARRPAGQTVFLSTHIFSEAESLCSRALLLFDGEIKSDAPAEQLEYLYNSTSTME